VFAANSARRSQQDWDEHSRILAAVIEGDEELSLLLATRHVYRAAEAAFSAQATVQRTAQAAAGSDAASPRVNSEA